MVVMDSTQAPRETTASRAIAVTARLPELGSVKTRLASALGDEEALRIYTDLLRRTLDAVEEAVGEDATADRLVAVLDPDVCADRTGILGQSREDTPGHDRGHDRTAPTPALLKPPSDGWRTIAQRGPAHGERLGNLFSDLLGTGYRAVVLLNGDSPGLPPAYLDQALTLLDEADSARVVLGPAVDGGFYLIGTDTATWGAHGPDLRRALIDARLGTAEALADVETAVRSSSVDVHHLPLWVDIDTAADLPLYERLTGQGDSRRLRGEPLEALRDVYLHVTNRCGRSCPHCYNRPNPRDPDELTTDEWRKVIDQCVALGTSSFVVIGGDPFCRDDLFDLIDHITDVRERNARIFFNGPCDKETAARLAEAGRGRLRPLLSVDGTREVNDSIRGAGNHDATLSAIRDLAVLGLRPVVNTVLLTPVLPTLPDLVREIKTAGATQIHLILPHERGAIVENADLIPDGASLRAAMEALTTAAAEIDLAIDNVPAWRRRLQAPRDLCTAGCRDVAVDPFGRVYACTITCGDPAFVAGDLRRERMEDVWRDSPALRLLRACRARDREECASCPVVDACGGECWVQAHYAARAAGRPAGPRAQFPYCDMVRPLFEQFIAEEAAGRAGSVCGPDDSCEAESAGGGQAAAGEATYALFDCI